MRTCTINWIVSCYKEIVSCRFFHLIFYPIQVRIRSFKIFSTKYLCCWVFLVCNISCKNNSVNHNELDSFISNCFSERVEKTWEIPSRAKLWIIKFSLHVTVMIMISSKNMKLCIFHGIIIKAIFKCIFKSWIMFIAWNSMTIKVISESENKMLSVCTYPFSHCSSYCSFSRSCIWMMFTAAPISHN